MLWMFKKKLIDIHLSFLGTVNVSAAISFFLLVYAWIESLKNQISDVKII